MNKKVLDGIYEFMAKAYQGNWQYRFGDTPFMTEMNGKGKRESILAHQWALMEFWFLLRRVCPSLDKTVDSLKLYEMIINHDLGETVNGDISLTRQMAGEGRDKHLAEHDQIKLLTKSLDPKIAGDILHYFDDYEAKIEDARTIEVLVVRFLDYLEGHHFALTFGNDLVEHSELIGKIVNDRWVKFTQRLIDVLRETGFSEASEEVKKVAEHHMNDIFGVGIKFDFEGFK